MRRSSTDFLFGKCLETIFSFTESDSFNKSPESASVVTGTCSEMRTEEPEPQSCTECPKVFNSSRGLHFSSKQSRKDLHASNNLVVLKLSGPNL